MCLFNIDIYGIAMLSVFCMLPSLPKVHFSKYYYCTIRWARLWKKNTCESQFHAIDDIINFNGRMGKTAGKCGLSVIAINTTNNNLPLNLFG